MAASETAYYVAPHIHPLLGPRLSVLLSSGTGTLCDTAKLSVQGERGADAKVLLSKSVGTVSFNR